MHGVVACMLNRGFSVHTGMTTEPTDMTTEPGKDQLNTFRNRHIKLPEHPSVDICCFSVPQRQQIANLLARLRVHKTSPSGGWATWQETPLTFRVPAYFLRAVQWESVEKAEALFKEWYPLHHTRTQQHEAPPPNPGQTPWVDPRDEALRRMQQMDYILSSTRRTWE